MPPNPIQNILDWKYEDFQSFVEKTQGNEDIFLTETAQILLSKAEGKFTAPFNTIDICGTGGDGIKTTNISTISSLVLACMEIPVIKHGGRAVSSSSGSVDFLEALKIPKLPPLESLKNHGICFLKAQNHHPAMKHIAPFRKQYSKKTIFNMLGPLLNPANISHQMVGTSFSNLELYTNPLRALGRKQFAVIRSQSGADELLPFEANLAIVEKTPNQTKLIINSKEYGLKGYKDESILGTTPVENTLNAVRFFENPSHNCLLETVALNCGFASYVFEKSSIKNGVELAIEIINSKKPAELLHKMQEKA